MKTEIKLWSDFYAKLGQVDLDCPSNDEVIRGTMGSSEFRDRADAIIQLFGAFRSILEIGCGYGGMVLEILELKKVSYTVVDNEAMLNQAQRFLGNAVKYVDARDIGRTLRDKKFDLFISHHCLSETPRKYRDYILVNIIKNCKKISVMDINDNKNPTRRMVRAGYEIDNLNIEKSIRKYFKIIKIRTGRSQSMYIGKRLK